MGSQGSKQKIKRIDPTFEKTNVADMDATFNTASKLLNHLENIRLGFTHEKERSVEDRKSTRLNSSH